MSFTQPRPKKYALGIAIFICLSLAVFLRLYRLQDFPIQVNVDELSNMYDAWSVAETGADRWGMKYPIMLRAFGDGDYKPSLYIWLTAGVIRVAGYSIWAGRLPSVLLGLLSLGLLYLTARKLGGRLYAFLALLSACFAPWHLHFSRLGLESAIFPGFLVLLVTYLWLRAKEKQYPAGALIGVGVLTGLATSASQASKLIFFLLTLLLLADLFLYSGRSYKKVFLFGCCCLLGAAPQLLAMLLLPERFAARANDTLMPFSFTFYYVSNVLRNVFTNISPAFLFFSFSDFNNETTGRLLPVEFPFFYLGLFYLGQVFRRPFILPPWYFYLLLFIVIFPSALTDSNPHALRASGLTVLLPLMSAAGMVYVWQRISSLRWQRAFLAATVVGVVANSLYFVSEYAGSDVMQHKRQQNYLALLGKRLSKYQDRYSRVYLEYMGNMPYIYIAHFCRIPPGEFQRAPKVIEKSEQYNLDLVRQMGKYYLLSPEEIDRQVQAYPGKSLIILQQRHASYTLIDSIEAYNRQKIFFYETH